MARRRSRLTLWRGASLLVSWALALLGAGEARGGESLERGELVGPPPSAEITRNFMPGLPRNDGGRRVWEYTLVISERHLKLADGTLYKVWAFGGSIPGPTLIAREGDWVRLKVVNETSTGHSLHSHGLWVPHRMDGAPHGTPAQHGAVGDVSSLAATAMSDHHAGHHGGAVLAVPGWTVPIPPGGTYVYEYIARPAGTHWYHCHVNTNEHLDRGMSGALVVLPRTPDPPVAHDVVFLLDEWDRAFAEDGTPGHPHGIASYDMFTINGRSFPETESIRVSLGDVVRVRLINAGALDHAIHLHGHEFMVTHKDGQPLPEPAVMDTIMIGPGERIDFVFVANNPGEWPLHCHSSTHVTNAGKYPGGMMLHFAVGDEGYPRHGDGPIGPSVRALREQWRPASLRAGGRTAPSPNHRTSRATSK